MSHPLLGATAIAGVGLTEYYRRGTSPDAERKLLLRAIVSACEDAGIEPADIDGFSGYGGDRADATSLMSSLGTEELRWSTIVSSGGGGGMLGAIAVAAAAVMTNQAEIVVVCRAATERESGRVNAEIAQGHINPHYVRHGICVPAQFLALRTQRMLEYLCVPRTTMDILSFVDYYHARNNPAAFTFLNEVTLPGIEESRWVVEPYRLLNCSRETDGAGALLLVAAARARDLRKPPIYLLGATQGAPKGGGDSWENGPDDDYALAGFSTVAERLWRQTGLRPSDVDVAQIYDNFSGLGVASLIQHGFCGLEEVQEFFTIENLTAPNGRLPINTDGGCLAGGFVHGIGGAIEAVRVLRGESSNPVPGAEVCLVAGGPGATFTSSALFGTSKTV